MPSKQQYIAIGAQVVGGGPFETVYNFDGHRFDTREEAIKHGFTLDRSDDFNIGVVEGSRLVSLDWMAETVVESDPAELAKIAEQICLGAR